MFCLLTSTSVIECLAFAFSLFDRNNLFVISKDELAKVFLTLNEGCFFYGDRPVPSPMVTDLANSIFTNAGKIDGDLCYRDYYDFILEHPIIEMYISAQFQGYNTKIKILSTTNLSCCAPQARAGQDDGRDRS